MISERKFSNSYASFWNQLLPTADTFVRQMNLASERFTLPIDSATPVDKDKRAVINELAFRLFKEKATGSRLTPDEVLNLEKNVRLYIGRLPPKINDIPDLTKDELKESEELSDVLSKYFNEKDLSFLMFWPIFKGCGQLDVCKGDIILSDKLIEVKAGDRHFRVIDIRQIITYLSLNSISKQYSLTSISLVNPRTGLCFDSTIDFLIESSSGRKAVDIFTDVISFISSEIGSI
jgi:hypothetical protein